MRLPWSSTILLAACRSTEPADPTNVDAVPTPLDTSEPWDGFQPAHFGPTDAIFAVDADGNAIAWSDPGGETVPVTMTFVIADDTIAEQGFTLENSCLVTFEHPGPIPPASWAAGLSAWAAWEMPADSTVTTDCARIEFPPTWSAGAEGVLRRWSWGFGPGPLDADVDADLQVSLGDDYAAIASYVAGGGYYWNGLVEIPSLVEEGDWPGGWVDTAVVFAYEVDASLVRTLVGGNPVLLERSTLPDGTGSVRSAQYELQATTLLKNADVLLIDLDE